MGSHLDSVTRGGRSTAAYGTIAALLLAAELRVQGAPVAAFVTCGEGSRFPMALTGVRGLLGRTRAVRRARTSARPERRALGRRWADAAQSGGLRRRRRTARPFTRVFTASRQLGCTSNRDPCSSPWARSSASWTSPVTAACAPRPDR